MSNLILILLSTIVASDLSFSYSLTQNFGQSREFINCRQFFIFLYDYISVIGRINSHEICGTVFKSYIYNNSIKNLNICSIPL